MSGAGQALLVFGAVMCTLLALLVLCYEWTSKTDAQAVRAAKFWALMWMLASIAGLALLIAA